MGYILPINPYQYMQYSNRIQYREENLKDFAPVKGTLPVFALSLKTRMDAQTPMNQAKTNPRLDGAVEYRKNSFHFVKRVNVSYITGKGLIIDEYV